MQDNIQSLTSYTFKSCQLYARIGHKAILIGKHILVFGGVNYHNDFVTSTLQINCQTYEVKPLVTPNTLPLQGYSIGNYQDKIYLWGGRKPQGLSNELWTFYGNDFKKIDQLGQIPKPRFYHSAVVYAEKYMVVYGGISNTQVFNDWHILNLQTAQWQVLKPNISLPVNLKQKFTWLGTRGILLISQILNKSKQIQEVHLLYQVKIRKKTDNNFILLIEQMNVTYEQKVLKPRSSPVICKFASSSLYLVIIGGQKFKSISSDVNHQVLPGDVWLLNLQTLVCKKAQHIKIHSRYGMQAIFYKDRIFIIGGVQSVHEFSTMLEVLDYKYQHISIDRKLCMFCKSNYGIQDISKSKISLKCQYTTNNTNHISANLVKKFSQVIRNPIKAFGLLIDNSIMMNANLIQIQIKSVIRKQHIRSQNDDKKQLGSMNQTEANANNQKLQTQLLEQKDKRNYYIEFTQNSYGFNKQQILESFFTFGYKTEIISHDQKFEQQLSVRKQYGSNLKLSTLRLGKSCLFLTNTTEQEKFVGFFSIKNENCPNSSDRFNCYYYFIDSKNNVSSTMNRHIIQKNIQNYLSLDKVQKKTKNKTKIYILDFNQKKEFNLIDQNSNLQFLDNQQGEICGNLKNYLKYLYFSPYVGRTIRLSYKLIDCQSMIDKYKSYQRNGKINRIELQSIIAENFQNIGLYFIRQNASQIQQNVYIYSGNRLICFFQFLGKNVCGYLQLKQQISIKIGKCEIQSMFQQKQLRKYLNKIIRQKTMIKRCLSNQMEDESISSISKPSKKVNGE